MPSFRAKTHKDSFNDGPGAGPIAMVEPTGVVDGDIYFLLILIATGFTTTGPGAPWALLNTWTGTNSNVYLFWCRRSGVPPLSSTLSGTPSYWEATLLAWKDC